MNYIDSLNQQKGNIQNQIKSLLEKYKVQPVGTGYIDLIVLNQFVDSFINELSDINILVSGITWWCHCTESTDGLNCQHGMGGPKSKYYDGWFSETTIPMHDVNLINSEIDDFTDKIKYSNDKVIKFIKSDFVKSEFYIRYLVPALWLYVPDNWERQ